MSWLKVLCISLVLGESIVHGAERDLPEPTKLSSSLLVTLAKNEGKMEEKSSQTLLSSLWQNKGVISHALSDNVTVATRVIFQDNLNNIVLGGILEGVGAPYRWLSGGWLWYETHNQIKNNPTSAVLQWKNKAVIAHLASDVVEVAAYYFIALADLGMMGKTIETGLNLIQVGSQVYIIGSTIYESITASSLKKVN